MFKKIQDINDIKPFVEHKKEIRFATHPNGVTIGSYQFMGNDTFDVPETIECRGIAFDENGLIVSRPLHKFFNMGEKEWLFPDKVLHRDDIASIYEKIDGSMIATAWVNGQVQWRSKKSFSSDVVKLTQNYLSRIENGNINAFADEVASNGYTAVFELTHPQVRIVIAHDRPALRLLHVRDNYTGEYVMMDPSHPIHDIIKCYAIQTVDRHQNINLNDALKSLENMKEREGFVVQFHNGDMFKIKCPWYIRLHRGVTFLRERDIALLALNEELDDVKAMFSSIGKDITGINAIEDKVHNKLTEILDEIDHICEQGSNMDHKEFALTYKGNIYFHLAMAKRRGLDSDVTEWYTKYRLKDDFGLGVISEDPLTDIEQEENLSSLQHS